MVPSNKKMKRLITILILLIISACNIAEELNEQDVETNIERGSAEIRTSLETYNYAKIIGMDFKTSSIDGEENEIQIIDDYVLIGRKDNYSIGLHNIDYSLSTDDSTYTRRIYNFPIRSGETTIYYDESFLVDVSFNITIEPSFDGDLNNMEKK